MNTLTILSAIFASGVVGSFVCQLLCRLLVKLAMLGDDANIPRSLQFTAFVTFGTIIALCSCFLTAAMGYGMTVIIPTILISYVAVPLIFAVAKCVEDVLIPLVKRRVERWKR